MMSDSLVKVVDGVSLLSDNVVETVCRVGVNQAVADPFGRFDAKQQISIGSRKDDRKTYFSESSVTKSNASSTPSSPISIPESRRAVYASRSNRSKYKESVLAIATRVPVADHEIWRKPLDQQQPVKNAFVPYTCGVHFYPSHNRSRLPIPEDHKPVTSCCQQRSTVDGIEDQS